MSATYDVVATGTSITLSKRIPNPAGRADRETFTLPLSAWDELGPALAQAVEKARDEQGRIDRTRADTLARRREALQQELVGIDTALSALTGQS